jgi:hypothetical protein
MMYTFCDTQMRPDWAIIGLPTFDGRVQVIASKDLTQVELEAKTRRYEFEFDDRMLGYDRIYTVTFEMSTFTIVIADSYPEAFRTLFDSWSPGPAVQPGALPAGKRELTSG